MSKKILLADDSITIQKVIELTFSDEDFDVVTVGNGRLALEKMGEVRPDIVLCDIIMPEKDGYEVCEQVKHNPASSHIPVLLLTGAFEPFDQERAKRAGYDGALAKPFEPETLIAKVKELLARAPLQAAPTPSAAPPSVVPFQRPAPPPPPPAPARGASFIPAEPLVGVEEGAFVADDAVEDRTSEPAEPLVEISPEEAEALAPPDTSADHSSASTVMFRAGDLPWNAPPMPERAGPPEAFEPEPTEAAEVVDESETGPQVFEEVIEEDLEFGPDSFTEDAEAGSRADAESSTVMFRAESGTVPPASQEEEAATGSFARAEESRPAATPPPLVPPPLPEKRPPVHEERVAPPAFETLSPVREPILRPEPVNPVATAWGTLPRRQQTAPAPPPAVPSARLEEPKPQPSRVESFADITDSEAEEPTQPASPVSGAGGVSVPVDMVEKIAQRVVAQISEKAVREIAWEVIPDLAEALIKQEIERLKAELQKL
jgi:CheY-like chemotaxis protein